MKRCMSITLGTLLLSLAACSGSNANRPETEFDQRTEKPVGTAPTPGTDRADGTQYGPSREGDNDLVGTRGNDDADTTMVDRDSRAPSGNTLTAADQSESEGDVRITQEIRKAVVADDSLSFTAKNVQIITRAAVVTLRGPVNSSNERASIEKKAKKVTGVVRVDNQLVVDAD